MKIFYFHCNFQPHKQPCTMWANFLRKSGT